MRTHRFTEPRACKDCGEYSLEPHQAACPFCDADTVPLSDVRVFRSAPMTPAYMLGSWIDGVWGRAF